MIDEFLNQHDQLSQWQNKAVVFSNTDSEKFEIKISELLEEYEEFKTHYIPTTTAGLFAQGTSSKKPPFYVFTKFDDTLTEIFFSVDGDTMAITLDRPPETASILPVSEETSTILFNDEINKRSFSLYSKNENELTEEELNLINK